MSSNLTPTADLSSEVCTRSSVDRAPRTLSVKSEEVEGSKVGCPRSLMDRALASEASDAGSIPTEGTKLRGIFNEIWRNSQVVYGSGLLNRSGVTRSWVRIPLPPPSFAEASEGLIGLSPGTGSLSSVE